MAALWGQVVTEGGHSPLAEAVSSVLGVPVMSKKSFIATEKEEQVMDFIRAEHAEGEKQLAKERCSFHEDVPGITVVVDGGWCKQTHKHSLNHTMLSQG